MTGSSQFLGIAATCFNLIGWVTYIVLQKKSGSNNNPMGWGLSLIIVMASGWSFFSVTKSIESASMYILGAAACLFVFVSSLKNKHKVSRLDKIVAIFSLAILPLAYLFPVVSIYIISLYYFATYSIFFRGVVSGDCIEDVRPWLIWSIAALLLTVSQAGNSIDHLVLPLTNLICWWGITVASFVKHKTLPQLHLRTLN